MIEKYFFAPKTLQRLRSGLSGPHIDGFAAALEQQGYAPASAVRYLRAAAHLGCFVQRRGVTLADLDASTWKLLCDTSRVVAAPSRTVEGPVTTRALG